MPQIYLMFSCLGHFIPEMMEFQYENGLPSISKVGSRASASHENRRGINTVLVLQLETGLCIMNIFFIQLVQLLPWSMIINSQDSETGFFPILQTECNHEHNVSSV
jgi:hypothetical protein